VRDIPVLLITALFAALSAPTASAYLWESQAVIERYGQPIKTTGYPDDRAYTYAFENFQIEIKFFDHVSHEETYSHSDRKTALSDSDIQHILEMNSAGSRWRKVKENDWTVDAAQGGANADYFPDFKPQELRLYTDDSVKRMIDVAPAATARTLKDQTLQGVVTLKKDDNLTRLIVRSGDLVIAIPWSAEGYPEKGRPTSGGTSTLTLRDEDHVDTNALVAFVSDREHKSLEDAIYDSKTYLVQRLKQNDDVLFDRSVCEVHHVAMSQKMAEVDYGMWAPETSADAYCFKNFPHHLDFILGGCVSSYDSPKAALHYVCPKCVAECEQFKREHPESRKH